MKLIKYENELGSPMSEMDHLFERAFGHGFKLPHLFNGRLSQMSEAYGFPLDLYDDDDSYYVVGELPGVDKGDIKIELENAVLSISGERKNKVNQEESRFLFSRSITVGDGVDADKVTATLENGILTVVLPKAEARKPKAITIG